MMGKIKEALQALDACSPAALRVFFAHGPRAARHVLGATLREAEHPTPPQPLRAIGWWDLIRVFSVDENLVLNGASWHDGSTTPIERVLIAQLMLFFKPKNTLELGTYRGDTTRLLLDHLPPGGTLYTIDLPAETDSSRVESLTDVPLVQSRSPSQGYGRHPRASDVKQVLGSTFDVSTWAEIPGDIQFAFIDASHSYEAVKNDTEWVRRKAARDAVILWHDYIPGESPKNGVGRFIRERMIVDDDVFVCSETRMAMRIPSHLLPRLR
jgi:predicted O-methyltransferase YrrM